MQYDYDLFVVGGGSGGVRAARLAGALGKKVGLAEGYRLGGTCVIRGCIPKKLMYYASEYHHHIHESAAFGWDIKEASFHWERFSQLRDKELTRLEGLYRNGLLNNGVTIHESYAKFLDPHTILLTADNKTITAKNILLSPGGIPFMPKGIPGIEHALTSNEVLAFKQLPKSIVIVGGGYISLEFACILHYLGVEVTLICRLPTIAETFDEELALFLQNILVDRGIKLYTNTLVETIIPRGTDGSSFNIHLSCGKILTAEKICYAIGRIPATAGLDLDKAGVKTDQKGAIITDSYKQTSQPHIYAIGDAAAGGIQLTPVAIHEAICFIETLYHHRPTAPDYELVATAVFSQPEMATIGLTEKEAVALYKDLDVYRTEFRPLKSTLSGNKEKVFIKILVEHKTDIVRGVHFVGPQAAEMVQFLGIALKAKLTKKQFDMTMAVHPTAAEEFVTLYQPSYSYRNGQRH